MNRAERRRAQRSTNPVAALERERQGLEAQLTAQARDIAAWIRTADHEPLDERIALVGQAIAEYEAMPQAQLVARGAIAELRILHDELSARNGAG